MNEIGWGIEVEKVGFLSYHFYPTEEEATRALERLRNENGNPLSLYSVKPCIAGKRGRCHRGIGKGDRRWK